MIKMSYFANIKCSKKLQSRAVCIALYPPKGWKGEVYKDLAPSPKLLEWWKKSKQDPEAWGKYTTRYREETLSKLDVNKVYDELNGKILVCFETMDKPCHRHIVAEWFRDNGYKCNEYIPKRR